MNNDLITMPSLGRMMVFIDGENIVMRYKTILETGRVPHDDVVYEPDTFVWRPSTVHPGLHHVVRATYYTYVQGDENQQDRVKETIKSLTFKQYSQPEAWRATGQLLNTLSPKVFRKIRGKKAKGVDIQLTVDILSNVYKDNLDTVFLVSGDGDYKPVLEEAVRHGKQVFVAAFTNGLNKEIKYLADWFFPLDDNYFKTET